MIMISNVMISYDIERGREEVQNYQKIHNVVFVQSLIYYIDIVISYICNIACHYKLQ